MRYSFGDNETATLRLSYLEKMFGPASRAFLRKIVKKPPVCALDLGCGSGHTTKMLLEELKPEKVVGYDRSSSHLQRADRDLPIEFRVHDVTETPFPDSHPDLIYARYLLSHLQQPEEALHKWADELAERGMIVCEDNRSLYGNHPILKEYIRLTEQLIKHNGGDLYRGRQYNAWSENLPLIVEHSGTVKIEPDIHTVLENFILNFSVWRVDPFIVRNFREDYLNSIAHGLNELLEDPGSSTITFNLHQLALKKV